MASRNNKAADLIAVARAAAKIVMFDYPGTAADIRSSADAFEASLKPTPVSGSPMLPPTDFAARCGVSYATILRRLNAGNFDATVARLAPQGLLDGVLIQSAAADLEWRAAEWRELGLWSVAFEELNGTTPWGLPAWIRASNQAGCREWSVYTAYNLPLSPLCNDLDARDPSAYEAALRAATGTATGFVLW